MNLFLWKKICSYAAMTSFAIAFVFQFVVKDIYVTSKVLIILYLVTSWVFGLFLAKEETNKIRMIAWINLIVITIGLQCFFRDLSLFRICIQLILALVAYFTYKRYIK